MKRLIFILSALALLAACGKSNLTPQEKLAGSWHFDNVTILGSLSAYDGTMAFDTCDSAWCTGQYIDSQNATRTIWWSMDAEGQLLSLIDTTSSAGSWGGDWGVDRLTRRRLIIKRYSGLGEVRYQLTKDK